MKSESLKNSTDYNIEAIKLFLKGLKINPNDKSLRKSVRRVIQYFSESQPRYISVKAQAYNKSNMNLNLQEIDAFNSKRGELILEHTTPIMSFVNHILTLKEEEWDNEIKTYSNCCWILKEEDAKLTSFGFRKNRPGGWEKCYDKCEIILCN
jgi:hypothetical protein